MEKFIVKDYLLLLGKAKDYINYYHKKLQENIKYAYDLDYHYFAFAQLIFALRERLITDFKKDAKKIKSFFAFGEQIKKTNIQRACAISKEWRHKDGMTMQSVGHIGVNFFQKNGKRTVKKVIYEDHRTLPYRHRFSKSKLIKIFNGAYLELDIFTKKNKYI